MLLQTTSHGPFVVVSFCLILILLWYCFLQLGLHGSAMPWWDLADFVVHISSAYSLV
jgi:hypothetical protein